MLYGNHGKKNGWHTQCNLLQLSLLLTTEIENGELHGSIRSRGSRFYHNPSLPLPPPPSINVGGSGKASDNMCWGEGNNLHGADLDVISNAVLEQVT